MAIYLKKWRYQGKKHRYSDRFNGFSIFVSKKNTAYDDSFSFAQLLGQQLINHDLIFTRHHAEKIKGENRPFLDEKLGIYRFDNLVLLKNAVMPSVLLECGIILNRDEELRVSSDDYRYLVADAVIQAVDHYRATLQPENLSK